VAYDMEFSFSYFLVQFGTIPHRKLYPATKFKCSLFKSLNNSNYDQRTGSFNDREQTSDESYIYYEFAYEVYNKEKMKNKREKK